MPDFASSEHLFFNMIALNSLITFIEIYKSGIYMLRYLLFNIGVAELNDFTEK